MENDVARQCDKAEANYRMSQISQTTLFDHLAALEMRARAKDASPQFKIINALRA